MNINIKVDTDGRLTSASLEQIRSSFGSIIGKQLVAMILPEIQRKIQRHKEAHREPIRFMRIADICAKLDSSPSPGLANGFSSVSPAVTMRPVESSNLRSVGYNQTNNTLRIEFKGGGVWDYLQVPPSEYDALMKAGSPGQYFHSHIRNRFQSRRIP